jgi:hypothetical protein
MMTFQTGFKETLPFKKHSKTLSKLCQALNSATDTKRSLLLTVKCDYIGLTPLRQFAKKHNTLENSAKM